MAATVALPKAAQVLPKAAPFLPKASSFLIAQDYALYTTEQHGTWAELVRRRMPQRTHATFHGQLTQVGEVRILGYRRLKGCVEKHEFVDTASPTVSGLPAFQASHCFGYRCRHGDLAAHAQLGPIIPGNVDGGSGRLAGEDVEAADRELNEALAQARRKLFEAPSVQRAG